MKHVILKLKIKNILEIFRILRTLGKDSCYEDEMHGKLFLDFI